MALGGLLVAAGTLWSAYRSRNIPFRQQYHAAQFAFAGELMVAADALHSAAVGVVVARIRGAAVKEEAALKTQAEKFRELAAQATAFLPDASYGAMSTFNGKVGQVYLNEGGVFGDQASIAIVNDAYREMAVELRWFLGVNELSVDSLRQFTRV